MEKNILHFTFYKFIQIKKGVIRMKKSKNYLVLVLCFVLSFSTIFTMSRSVEAEEYSADEFIELFLSGEVNNEVLELEPFEIELINEAIKVHERNGKSEIKMFAAAVGIGNFVTNITIIGVGTVAIYTGGVMIGNIIASTGSALFNTVKSVVSPYITGATIPKSLRKDGNTVDLGQFKDKHLNTPLNKNSGEFFNGKWSVDKDTGGHGGRKWKIKKNGDRKASLDKNGKILAD
ncbi:hypothetical protein [Sporosarcina sp. FA15]|uniref:hypothetical protein n=1 Tax=Sporosarcina sp. FA15 TaxID=3413031 RepID=UPI003F65ABDA